MKPLIAAVFVLAYVANGASSTVPGVEPIAGNANLLGSGIPPIPNELKSRVSQYLNTRSAMVLDQSDDGSQVLISTRFGSTAQLHLVDHPLGDRQQLTFTQEPITSAHFLPGDPRIIFYGQDVGGGEFFQWYRLDRAPGRAQLLTDRNSRQESFILSRDAQSP